MKEGKVGIVTKMSVSALGLGWGRALRDVHSGVVSSTPFPGWAGLGLGWGLQEMTQVHASFLG